MLTSIFNTFFPEICAACEQVLLQNEQVVCTHCMHKLPVIANQEIAEEYIRDHFYGRIEIAHAGSLLYYQKKGLSQHLIHRLKYFGDERISAFLGNWLAQYLLETDWAKTVDVIIPVPLHKNRKRKRGFNQVSGFGQALAANLNCAYDEETLIKIVDSRTQVFKNRFARAEIKDAYFFLKDKEKIKGKHVLLVDDIITTGATLESCAENLLKGDPSKISLLTMSIAV